jgi:hypothetical protein
MDWLRRPEGLSSNSATTVAATLGRLAIRASMLGLLTTMGRVKCGGEE